MKRATLEATDENILQSIKEQNGTRNTEIKDFIEALELIEGNMFISLDARWGEGKTFYVRQIEKTLEYQTMKNFSTDDTQDELDKMKLYFTGTTLEEIDLKKLAKLAGRKNVEMIHQKDLLPVTGYMRGGCSPVGMKKQFPTYMDESILKVDEVAFSAGKRGFQMIVKVQDILTYLNVETGDIIRK